MKKKERKSAGPRFLLNRSGVPLSEEAWDRMFNFYNKEDKQLRYSKSKMAERSDAKIAKLCLASKIKFSESSLRTFSIPSVSILSVVLIKKDKLWTNLVILMLQKLRKRPNARKQSIRLYLSSTLLV